MMKHSDFSMGTVFWTGSGKWRCTDWDLLLLSTMDYPLCFERPRRS